MLLSFFLSILFLLDGYIKKIQSQYNKHMTDIFSYDNQIFTELELYQKLGFSTHPSDRELEAKIIMYIRKYNGLEGESNQRLLDFFSQVYEFFFEREDAVEDAVEDADGVEGFVNDSAPTIPPPTIPPPTTPAPTTIPNITNALSSPLVINSVAYKGDVMNPILKQTIQRVVIVDSTYRNLNASNARLYPFSTNFTIELSEPLRDVLSLKLYSYSIPYTWYTINNDYGSNFFILKGTSPGLSDLGAYDFQVAIAPGNYNPTTLVAAVKTSFANLALAYSDVNFGTTTLVYNPVNTLASFTIDLQSIYHENAYQLSWPTWSSPANTNRIDTSNNSPNIPAYLGFDSPIYDINTIYSVRNSIPPTSATDMNQSLYHVDDTNKSFKVIHYYEPPIQDANGYYYVPEYISTQSQNSTQSQKLDEFVISLSLLSGTSYSRNTIETNLRSQLQACSFLNSRAYSDDILVRVDETNASYYKMNISLNRAKAAKHLDSKVVVIFPDEKDITTLYSGKLPLWTGKNSCFQFNSFQNDPLVVELNNLYSEISLYSSTYNVSLIPCIELVCHTEGYINNKNTVIIHVATNTIYNLSQYMERINYALNNPFQMNGGSFNNFPKTNFSLNPSSKPQLSLDYNLTFTNYFVSLESLIINGFTSANTVQQGSIQSSIGAPFVWSTSNNQSLNPTFVLSNVEPPTNTYSIPLNYIVLKLQPNLVQGTFGTLSDSNSNKSTLEYQVPFLYKSGTPIANSYQYTSFEQDFFTDFKNSILQFQDITGSYPLSQSIIEYSNYVDTDGQTKNKILLTLNIRKTLTQHDFTLNFYDLSGSTKITTNSSWARHFHFDTTYDLASYPGESSTIIGPQSIDGETVKLIDTVNNYFDFVPKSSSVGLYTSIPHTVYTGLYYNDLRIIVPCDKNLNGEPIDTPCNNIVLFNKMNAAFSAKDRTRGTFIDSIDLDGKQYCKFRININHIFTTSDYILDFFDVSSFIKCYVGATSVRNTTWDTTLGWILGFHEHTSYPLYPYLNVGNTGIATLIGDTSVNTNLYNYLFISLDDFNQNRLNDGIVTIAKTDSKNRLPSYASRAHWVCPDYTSTTATTSTTTTSTTTTVVSNGSTLTTGQNNLTGNQVFAINQVLNSQKSVAKIYSQGPFMKDVFAVIPLKIPSNPGDMITEFGGSLQNQNRFYFGPVNVRRLQAQLYTDKGNILDLNGSNWNFKFICEQLYQKQTT